MQKHSHFQNLYWCEKKDYFFCLLLIFICFLHFFILFYWHFYPTYNKCRRRWGSPASWLDNEFTVLYCPVQLGVLTDPSLWTKGDWMWKVVFLDDGCMTDRPIKGTKEWKTVSWRNCMMAYWKAAESEAWCPRHSQNNMQPLSNFSGYGDMKQVTFLNNFLPFDKVHAA